MAPSSAADDYFTTVRKGKRGREQVGDSKLAGLEKEVEAPTGEVSLVFTNIKNSTIMWETYPVAMQLAIKQHNEVMRRHLRLIGGYEVKTEGDAFIDGIPYRHFGPPVGVDDSDSASGRAVAAGDSE